MMSESEALITAARRYCLEHHAYWSDRYARERSGTEHPYTYSDSDYNLFPRYNVLSVILGEVEKLVGAAPVPIPELKATLAGIGRSASSMLTGGEQNDIEAAAIAEERRKFIAFIETLGSTDLVSIEPLPYRRRLAEDEREAVREKLYERWNFAGDYWDPVEELSPEPVMVLRSEDLSDADLEAIANLVGTCASVFYELNEDGSDAEIEAALFDARGYETVHCDKTFEWIVYASHEGTLSFGGIRLQEEVRNLFAGRSGS